MLGLLSTLYLCICVFVYFTFNTRGCHILWDCAFPPSDPAMIKLPPKRQKRVSFQLKFHPVKHHSWMDIGPYMESSWSLLFKTTITFKFLIYSSRVLERQRKLEFGENGQKRQNRVDFQMKFHPAKNFRWPKKNPS